MGGVLIKKKGIVVLLAWTLITSSFVTILNTNQVKAEEAINTNILENWWNSDWNYRKQLTIDTPVEGYQMELTLWIEDGHDDISKSFIDCENKCNDDFSDIRFADENKNEIPYWIALTGISDGDHYATIWVNTTGANSLYLYYGNTTATSTSNGDDVWYWYDDFNDGQISGWSYDYSKNDQGGVTESGGLMNVWANGNSIIGWRSAILYSHQKFPIGTKLIGRVSANYDWHKSWNSRFGFSEGSNYGDTYGVFFHNSHSEQQWRCVDSSTSSAVYLGSLDSLTQIEIHRIDTQQCMFRTKDHPDEYITTNIPDQDCGVFVSAIDNAGADEMHIYLDYIAVGKTSEIEPSWSVVEAEESLYYGMYPPTAEFTYSPSNPTDLDVITFFDTSTDEQGTIFSRTWSFGDGEYAYEQEVSHKYSENGIFTVTLSVTDNDGNTDEVSEQITILNVPPEANIIYYPSNPQKDELIVFNDASTDLDGEIISWEWRFGDGYSSTDKNPEYQYSEDGIYLVSLVVEDDDGNFDNCSTQIIIGDNYLLYNEPEADFLWVSNGLYVDFIDNSFAPAGTLISWSWDFGDGGTSSLQNPTHVYSQSGTYQITLTVDSDNGESGTIIEDITINKDTSYNVISLYPTDDTFIRMKSPDRNTGSGSIMPVRNRYGHPSHPEYWELDILIKFDLSSIPSGSEIRSADLFLFFYSFDDTSPYGRELTCYQILEDWEEIIVTWNTRPDYASEVTDSAIVPNRVLNWMNWDVTEDVQDVVSQVDNNFGWQIMDEVAWGWYDIPYIKFLTKEFGDFVPYLRVEYIENDSNDFVFVDDDYDPSTPGWGVDHFDTIQDGINNVPEEGTVYVYNGVYHENVVIDKTLNLIGEDKVGTIIDGGGKGSGIKVTASWVNISEFTVKNSGSSWAIPGIYLLSNSNTISNNKIISNNGHGIRIDGQNNNIIKDNEILFNKGSGIRCQSVSNNIISCNNISDNSVDGIKLLNSNDNTVLDNYFSNNSEDGIFIKGSKNNNVLENTFELNGISIEGWTEFHWDTHTIENNTVNGRPIRYYKKMSDVVVPTDTGQVILANCTDFIIQNLNLLSKGDNISLGFSSYNSIINNNIASNNMLGIGLYYSSNNNIIENTISNCRGGINLKSSNNNKLNYNTIISNSVYGIYIEQYFSSNNNIIYHNNFINNNLNAYDWHTNNWDDGYPSGGNYWSDYTGTDSDGDGIGDTPYQISGNNKDNYPFMVADDWVQNKPPKAEYIFTSNKFIVNFTDQSLDTDGTIEGWEWDFGDGVIGYEQNPIHQYSDAGTYEVKLTVTDDDGDSNTKTEEVNVRGNTREKEIILYAIEDSYIRMKSPDRNSGSGKIMAVRNRYGSPSHPEYWELNSLVKFDLTLVDEIQDIYSATLNVYYSEYNDNNPSGRRLNLYEIQEPWDENTVTWNNRPSISDQITSYTTVPSSPGSYMSWDVTDDVSDTLLRFMPDYGWQIMDENRWGSYDIPYIKFKTSENDQLRPYLKIEYIGSDSNDIVFVDDDYNNDTKGWNLDRFDNIQDGINNVTDGGLVYIYSGIYYENVIINKTLTMMGEDQEKTIIDGNGVGDVVTFYVDDCTIKNMNIRNSGDFTGVKILSNRNTLTNNIIYDNYYGIWIEGTIDNTISDNIISNNKGGIRLKDTTNTIVSTNQILSNSLEGITLESSYYCTIVDNVYQNNGITITGPLSAWNTHTIDNNIANNKPIYYYKNENGITVPSDAYQVILANCKGFEIKNTNFDNRIVGIQLGYCLDIRIENNVFNSNDQSAIMLYYSDYNTIIDNTINGGNGIDLWESKNNNIQLNSISSTSIAINMYQSEYNNIKFNTITDNSFAIWMHNYCSYNVLHKNTITSNDHGGIWLMEGCSANVISNNSVYYNGHLSPQKANIYINGGCTDNSFYGNTIKSNGYTGIYIEYDPIGNLNNKFYHNNFLNNDKHAYDKSINNWDNEAIFSGNYWDDYTGADNNDDGIGDTPYDIPGGENQDRYPNVVMSSWNNPPYDPSNPYPANNEFDVPINNISLSWSCYDPEDDSLTYDVYFGTTDQPEMINNYDENEFYLSNLDYDTTYYWQIVAHDENFRTTIGPIWCFTTENRPPVANFEYSPISPLKNQEITFTDTSTDVGGMIEDWYWEFGDGSSSTEQHPKHIYTRVGTYNVYLLVTDDKDDINYIRKTIYVETAKPTADFTYSPSSPNTNDYVQFTDLSSDSDGSIVSRTWYFGDGSVSGARNPSHRYYSTGTYSVRLYVTDNDGGSDSLTHSITISSNIVDNTPPSAGITYSPVKPNEGQSVQFTSVSTDSDGSIIAYRWYFGDGSSSNSRNPTHSYSYTGTYTITLIVTDNKGAQDSAHKSISVGNLKPAASFQVLPTNPTIKTLVSFIDKSVDTDGSIVSWSWNFGDGSSSTEQNPTHQYSSSGGYRITLTVTDNEGKTDTEWLYKYIYPNSPPRAQAGGPYNGRPDALVTMDGSGSYDSDGSIVGYRWDFNNDWVYDTDWSISPTVTYSYTSMGYHIVRLQVKDDDGSRGSDYAVVCISYNVAPSAIPGGPYYGKVDRPIILDGSRSYDSDGSIVGYRWDFDNDGVYDTGWLTTPTVSHVYTRSGTYWAKLQIKDNEDATSSNNAYVSIRTNRLPVADVGQSYYCTFGDPILIDGSNSYDPDGSIVGYRWDFNDDGIYDTDWLTSSAYSYTYSYIGIFTARLQVKDNDEAIDTDTAVVIISENAPPVADAGGSYSGRINDNIAFDASGSYDPDGSIVGYRWDFDNDNIYETGWLTSQICYFNYTSSGTYAVKLQVKDDHGATGIGMAEVDILANSNPVADAGGPYVGFVNQPITFDGSRSSDSDGVIVGYKWDFNNDGTYDTEWILAAPSYVYSSMGTYTVLLMVKDNDGDTDIDTAIVTIESNDPPVANAGGPYVGFVGESIIFDGSGSHDDDGSIVGYRWDYNGDGVYDTGWLSIPKTTNSYSLAGEYSIKLMVMDDDDSTATDTGELVITDSHLRGLWHFDEGSGSIAYDSSAYGNNGQINGASWAGTGKYDNSLSYNGANDYVNVDGIVSSYDYFTVSVWAKFDNLIGTMPIISRQDGTGIGRNILTLQNGEIKTNINGTEISTGFSPDNEWHHYVLTYYNGVLKIYVDTILKVTENATEEDATGSFIFGADKDLGTFFDGMLDEIAIWSRTLLLYEIQNLYCVPNQPTFENPANRSMWIDPNIGALSCIVSEPYEFEEPTIEEITVNGVTYDRVEQEGSEGYGEPGEPRLPARGAYILLPEGTDVSNIKIITGEREYLGKDYYVEPVAMATRLDSDEIEYPVPDDVIYNSYETFPGEFYTEVGTYKFRGYKILVLALHSVQYVPATGELYYYKDMIVTVGTSENNTSNELFRGLDVDKLATEDMVDNPGMSEWYENPSQGVHLAGSYDMVIITTNSLKDGFEPLKQAHGYKGCRTLIYTVEDIYGEYSGVDNAEKIRNFIIYAYVNLGIQYVLIGGDEDVVPARRLWVQSWSGGYTTTKPSDVYYSCLDGPFNNDGDSRWGEPNDGEGGADVDLIAEVYVGRATVGNAQEVNNFVSKTIEYMNSEDEYLKDVLMVGEYLGFGCDAQYATAAMNELIDGTSKHGYTTVGIPSDEYNIDKLYDAPGYRWPKSALINHINNDVHIVNHLGHANYGYNMKLYSSDLNSFTNEKYCFIYSQGCMAGGFDQGDCIAEHFTVKNDVGAFAGIWNARYGWGRYCSTDGPSQRFHREFWDAVFSEDLTSIGKANSDSKEDNLYRIGSSCMRWCYYGLNLFGDPALDFINRDGDGDGGPDGDGGANGIMDVNFYWGDGTLIGVDEAVSNNTIASVEIEPLTRYKNLSWYVVIDDGFNEVTGPTWWFTVDAYDWDINRDGRVDDIDSELLISLYGEAGDPGWRREDIIPDGMINIKDISVFADHYGESYLLEFVKDDNSLTITSVNLNGGIKWSELEIIGNANVDNQGPEVAIGDRFINCEGTVTLRYTPFDTVTWTWTFGEGSSQEPPAQGEPPAQYIDCDINDDGIVDEEDLDSIADHYGETGEPGWIPEDVNEDGRVDSSDIINLVEEYEETNDEYEENEESEEEDSEPSQSQSNDDINQGGNIEDNSQPSISDTLIQTNDENDDIELTVIDELNEFDEQQVSSEQNSNYNSNVIYLSDTVKIPGRSVSISGKQSSLVSVDDDYIPEYIRDETQNVLIPVTYAPGVVKTIEENEESITVTIGVQKANWIYIEIEDQYPEIKDLTVTTSDGRVISSDMIWRENGKIYVLDDPDVVYHFIYNTPSSGTGYVAAGARTLTISMETLTVIFATLCLSIIGLAVIYKRNRIWNHELQKAKDKIKEIDKFIDDFERRCH